MKWVNAADQTPNTPGQYHTNLGLTDWGNSGTEGDPELYWLNRHGGQVQVWLDESTEDQSLLLWDIRNICVAALNNPNKYSQDAIDEMASKYTITRKQTTI